MKRFSILIAILTVMVFSFGSLAVQNGYDLFQKALAKERAEGNLEEAIALYQKVIEESKDESLAAKAQLRIGICYEKLGKQEAKKAYQKVIDNYPRQIETVKLAQKKLSILIQAQSVSEKGGKELAIRKVWSGAAIWMGGPTPDGRFLIFTSLKESAGGLAVQDLITGKSHILTKNPNFGSGSSFGSQYASNPVVSPEGKRVVYSCYNFKDEFLGLKIIGLDGSQERTLFIDDKTSSIIPTDWSADGRFILACLRRNGDPVARIVTISADNGSLKVIKTLGKEIGVPRGLSFSPDCRYIAYDNSQDEKSDNNDIYLLSADGNFLTPLIEHPANDLFLGWVPDGANVLFASDRTGSWGLWTIGIEKGKPKGIPQIIKRDMGPLIGLGFSKQGSFFFAQGSGSRDVYTANIDLADAKLLDLPTIAINQRLGSNFSPAWSPDGQSLAYMSPLMPQVKNVIHIRSIKTGEEHVLSPPLDWIRGGGLQWFPDGKHLTVCGGDSDKVIGHFQIDVQSGNTKLICPGEKGVQFYHASVSPESNEFYYIKNYWSEKLSLVIRRDIMSGEEEEICRKEGGKIRFIGISVSPNGKWIALGISLGASPPAPSSLAIIPAEGGELVELARFENPFWLSGTAWVPDSRSLLFTKMTRVPNPSLRKQELYLISVGGGEPESLGTIGTGVGSLSVHPDGKQIIFERNEYKIDVWTMENFLPDEKKERKGGQR